MFPNRVFFFFAKTVAVGAHWEFGHSELKTTDLGLRGPKSWIHTGPESHAMNPDQYSP